MNHLTFDALQTQIERLLPDFLPRQIVDPIHPDLGAVFCPDEGMTNPWLAEKLIKLIGYHTLLSKTVDESLLERANLAADALQAAQRPSGLIDLRNVNIDSSPDTAFTVKRLCCFIDLAQQADISHPLWAALLEKLETFVRRTIPGLLVGGFHTPNHRWVLTAALAYAHHLFPDLEVANTVEAYLAEGFDIDADGTYIERSIGVYDAVNNRGLLLIADFWDQPEVAQNAAVDQDALDAVARNLDFDLHMLHADGTAVTNLSRRQDYGTRSVPIGLISCYLLQNRLRPDPLWVAAANHLWNQYQANPDKRFLAYGDIDWISYALLKSGESEPVSVGLPTNYARHYPVNGMWRVRREQLSASLFQGKTGLLSLAYGRAELSSMKISFTYFGDVSGWFWGDTMTVDGDSALLHSTGLNRPRRPGYELPLGKAVPPEAWEEMVTEREVRRVPPMTSELRVTEVEGGFDLQLATLDGFDKVAGQIAFDFAPGGVWETNDTRVQPQAGQTIFLKQGSGSMRYGNDLIQITPGHDAHAYWEMRAAETAPDHVRVLLTFFTPVDHLVQLRVYQGF